MLMLNSIHERAKLVDMVLTTEVVGTFMTSCAINASRRIAVFSVYPMSAVGHGKELIFEPSF